MLKNVYEGLNARPKVYLSKEYFCEMYPSCMSSKLCEFISLLTAAFFFLFSHFRLNYFLPCLLCIASWVIFSIEWLVLKSYSFSSFGCFQLFSHFLAQKYSSLVCFFWGESFNKALMQHRPGQHLSNGLCLCCLNLNCLGCLKVAPVAVLSWVELSTCFQMHWYFTDCCESSLQNR